MAEELGTRDVLEQVDTRLTNIEQDLRAFRNDVRGEYAAVRSEMREGFAAVRGDMNRESAALRSETNALRGELNGFRTDTNTRFEKFTRWNIGFVFATWLTVMASIWLKP